MSLNWSFQRLVIVRSQLYYTNAGATRGTVVSIKVVKYIQKCIYCMYVFTILAYVPKEYIYICTVYKSKLTKFIFKIG